MSARTRRLEAPRSARASATLVGTCSDLDAFVRSAVAAKRLTAFKTPQPGDVYMICVPTPFHEGEGIPQPNIDYVLAATRSIAGKP